MHTHIFVFIVQVGLEDLQAADPAMHQAFQNILRMDENEIHVLDLTFEVELQGSDGTVVTRALKKDGGRQAVTVENKLEYVQLYTHCLLHDLVR